jgi:amidophosphoribosyltransferase
MMGITIFLIIKYYFYSFFAKLLKSNSSRNNKMSELIKHECGIALVRLLKPLEYYLAKYGTSFYGLNKLHLLMQKQHNRGQDGAGIANIKLDIKPGNKYISRLRSNSESPIKDIFNQVLPVKYFWAIYGMALLEKMRWAICILF